MPSIPLSLVLHNTKEELLIAYKSSSLPIEKTRIHLIWMLRNTQNETNTIELLPEEGAKRCGMSTDWARRTIRAYNSG